MATETQIDTLFAALCLDPSLDKFKAMKDVGIVVDDKPNKGNAAVVLSPETKALMKLKSEENYSIVRGLYHYKKKKQNRGFLNRDFIKVLYSPMMESTSPDLILPASLKGHERQYAHTKAGEYGWRSLSHGEGNDRRIQISIAGGATTREEQRILEEATVVKEHKMNIFVHPVSEWVTDKFELSELDCILRRAGVVLDYRVDPNDLTKTEKELRENSDTKKELKGIAKVWMENVLSKAHIYTSDVGNSKVVVASDILHALELTYGRCVLGYGSTVFKLPVSNHSIYKVLRQVHRNCGIGAEGMQVVSDALAFIFRRIMDHAIHLSSSNKLKTLSNDDEEKITYRSVLVAAGVSLYEEIDSDSISASRSAGASARTTGADAEVPITLLAQSTKVITGREIQTAVRFELPGELAKHAVSEGTKAVTKYASNFEYGRQRDSSHFVCDLNRECGLQFSVFEVAAAVADLHPDVHLSVNAANYLTAVLEYMSAELLELSGNAARDNKKYAITPRHVQLALRNDEELNKQFRVAVVACGGVLPNIHSQLIPKKLQAQALPLTQARIHELKASTTTAVEVDTNSTRKAELACLRAEKFQDARLHSASVDDEKMWYHTKQTERHKKFQRQLHSSYTNYTVYLRQVRNYQKNTDLLLNTYFKELISSHSSVVYSRKALNVLQTALESFLVCVAQEANFFAIHDGRVDVQPRDVQIAQRVAHGRNPNPNLWRWGC